MPTLTLKPVPYRPSSPLAGNEADAILRGKNVIMRGTAPQVVYEAYPGSENLGENYAGVAITGTLTYSAGDTIIQGNGTDFYDELHIGQKLLCNGEPLSVAEILAEDSFRNARPVTSDATNEAATRAPRIFPLDVNRGVQLWGNATQFDKGTIASVGDGVLYRNGAVLPGTSLTASRNVAVATYDSTTGNYTPVPLGFDVTPIAPSVTITGSGGSKNMSLGSYSFRVAYYSSITGGYSNPTDVILAASNAPFVLSAANSQWVMDFTADVANRPAHADGYVIYQSSFSGSAAISAVNAIQGGWFEAKRVLFSDLSTNTVTFEAVDSDLSTLVTFDNDPPADAEFLAQLDSYVILISCRGKGVGSDPARVDETSPGPFISPMKADNIDGYPATLTVPTEKGETIIGAVAAAGRIFVLTANTLQAVSSTGIPSAPMIVRPFWRRGFASPDNLAFVDDTLYGFTTKGPYRSIATGDSAAESNDFATDVETEMANWHAGYVFVVGDTTAESVCFIYSGSKKNDQGYWETDILPYSLQQRAWMPPIVLSDPDRDMIVSGAAQINGYLEFIAGGRRNGDTERWDTWRYNTGSGTDVDCYLAWQFTDNGAEMMAKWIRKLRPKGKFAAGATLQLYAVTSDDEISLTDLETGANATFSYNLGISANVKQYGIQKCRVRNGLMWTGRLEWTSNHTSGTTIDQVHEIAAMVEVWGQER